MESQLSRATVQTCLSPADVLGTSSDQNRSGAPTALHAVFRSLFDFFIGLILHININHIRYIRGVNNLLTILSCCQEQFQDFLAGKELKLVDDSCTARLETVI